jgi:hypothetical protein
MSEGIDYEQLGTIIVSFDDKTYTLTRPKMGQWRYFSRKLQALYDENRETLLKLTGRVTEMNEEVEALKEAGVDTKKAAVAQAKAQAALREYQIQPFYETTIPWLREVFVQLGDKKLPESEDDWPVWLAADLSVPTQIVAHWRTNPKVSGATS